MPINQYLEKETDIFLENIALPVSKTYCDLNFHYHQLLEINSPLNDLLGSNGVQ